MGWLFRSPWFSTIMGYGAGESSSAALFGLQHNAGEAVISSFVPRILTSAKVTPGLAVKKRAERAWRKSGYRGRVECRSHAA